MVVYTIMLPALLMGAESRSRLLVAAVALAGAIVVFVVGWWV